MRSGRRPSPEGTRLLFAGTISCPAGGPTDGRHTKTRQEDKSRKKELTQNGQSYVQLVGEGRPKKAKFIDRKDKKKSREKRAERKGEKQYNLTSCRSEYCASAQPDIFPKRTD